LAVYLIIESNKGNSANQLELDELEFRFNNRGNSCMFRDAMFKMLLAETLPYARLIGISPKTRQNQRRCGFLPTSHNIL
jgi:hypothetical protein